MDEKNSEKIKKEVDVFKAKDKKSTRGFIQFKALIIIVVVVLMVLLLLG